MKTKNQELLDVFNFRHACKKFDAAKIISEEDFDTILEAGRLSPSSFGFEPWKFLVIQNKEMKEKLYPAAWGARNSLEGASHFVIILARKKNDTIFSSDYIMKIMTDVQNLSEDVAQAKKEHFENFQKNDFELLESDRSLFDWASKQTYIAMANMLTAAAFLGIDSCPIEGYNIKEVEKLLENEGILDTSLFGVSVMAGFGYRGKEPYPKTRQSQSEVVQWI